MSTYVLVHGGWHGSWCWKRVRKALQLQGHEVFTPTLTGLGERSHLPSPHVNLDTHIEDVVNLIKWEELSDVVLCGHSYGGCVISGVADRVSTRIGALIYLDAFVLRDGQSLWDTVPPILKEMHLEGARRTGDGWKVPPIPSEVFNVNNIDRAWVNRQCTPQPLATLQQSIKLGGGADTIDNVTFVLTTAFNDSPFPPFYEEAKARGWNTRTLACGHDAMLDLPEKLTQLLVEVAH
jgi:pimeloyl-ACP methyl ester carboxylesterase